MKTVNRIVLTLLGTLVTSNCIGQVLSTEDFTPNDDITTEDLSVLVIKAPMMHDIGSVNSGSNGLETPNMDILLTPMNGYIIPGQFSLEFVANLKKGQLANMLRKGWIKEGEVVRMLSSRRSAQEDLELYSMSLTAHQRAIMEGKRGDYYIDMIKSGLISLARIKRDVEVCGTNFEIYADSKLCSLFHTHELAEQHYKASVDTIKAKNNELTSQSNYNAYLVGVVGALQGDIKKLKKKGRR